jgi:hypothetical protein
MKDCVDVKIDSTIQEQLMKLTKTELVEKLIVSILGEQMANKESARLRQKVDIAESYVAQGRAMIDAVMERWDEYDV